MTSWPQEHKVVMNITEKKYLKNDLKNFNVWILLLKFLLMMMILKNLLRKPSPSIKVLSK